MPIPNRRITDLQSFLDVTAEPRQIAGLYFYQMLDCLVDLAHAVAIDFRRRPQVYRDLGSPSSIAPTLAKLDAQYGTETNVLSEEQRAGIFLPIFGHWDAASAFDGESFPKLQDEIVEAAAAFAERSVDTGVSMLRERVKTTHRPFKDYLVGLQGDSLNFSKEQALFDLTEHIAYPILRNLKIAAIFGIPRAASANDYPYATDAVQDVLVEEASRQLMPAGPQGLTRERISNLQRAALRGAEAIATAIDFDEASATPQTDEDLDRLITKCYTWGAALRCLSAFERPKTGSEASVPRAVGRVAGSAR